MCVETNLYWNLCVLEIMCVIHLLPLKWMTILQVLVQSKKFKFCVLYEFLEKFFLQSEYQIVSRCYAGGGRRFYIVIFFVNSRKLIWYVQMYAYSKRLAQFYIFSKVKVVKILLTTANPWCIQKAHWGEKSSQSKYPQNEVIKKLMRHIFFPSKCV